jgi:hypothetical protein
MTSAADTIEIKDLFDRMDEVDKILATEIINGMARGRLSCEEIAIATERMQAGGNKLEVLEGLVQLSNERIFESDADIEHTTVNPVVEELERQRHPVPTSKRGGV